MTHWIVTRHPGAVDWLYEHGLSRGRHVCHLDVQDVCAGDTVIGTLPVSMIAAVVERGAAYHHLEIPMRVGDRGRELSAADLDRLGATLRRYTASRLPQPENLPDA